MFVRMVVRRVMILEAVNHPEVQAVKTVVAEDCKVGVVPHKAVVRRGKGVRHGFLACFA